MENAMQQANTNQLTQRDITIVTKEIKDIQAQAQRVALVYAVEIGRRLCEAKELLPHGEWGTWLGNEVNFSSRTAQNFMALFNEYGNAQLSIFGAMSNTQTFADLPYTKALALLAVPADERKEFAEEVNVNEISVRELNEAIAAKKAAEAEKDKVISERDDAISARDDALDRLAAAQEDVIDKERKINFGLKENQSLADTIKQLKSEKAAAQKSRDDALEEVNKAIAKKREAEEALKKAQDNPVISDDIKAEITAEAAQEARDTVKREYESKLAEASDKVTEAMKKAESADIALKEAEARLRTANPDVAAFKALFETVQKTIIDLKARADRVEQNGDAETAAKLRMALKKLAETM